MNAKPFKVDEKSITNEQKTEEKNEKRRQL